MYCISLMTHFTMTFSCCQKQILFLNLRSTQNGLGFSLDNKKHRDFVLRCFFNEEKRREEKITQHTYLGLSDFSFSFAWITGTGELEHICSISVCVIQFLVSALWHKNRNQIKHIACSLACNVEYFHRKKIKFIPIL